MNKNPADPRRRAWPLALGAGALLALALLARVLALGFADHAAARDPGAALRWRSDHPEARLAAQRPASPGALAAARAAIAAAPLDGRGYRALAEAALATGQGAGGERYYRLAAARAPRDLHSQVWLLNRAIAGGDHGEAMRRSDRILRVEPELLPLLQPVLDAAAAAAAPRRELAAVLAAAPPWRGAFLARLAAGAPDPLAVQPLFEQLRRAPPGLPPDELKGWLERLVRDRQWGPAYLTWASALDADARQRLGNVFDGGFTLEPHGWGFGWRFGRVPGARIERAPAPGAAKGQALRVHFDDRRTPFAHVRQLLALAPGEYRLAGRARLDDLRSERGLAWTLACADDGRRLGSSEAFRGRRDWHDFTLAFSVPAQACGGQWLTLALPARIPAEQRIGGTAWFDDLSIRAVATR